MEQLKSTKQLVEKAQCTSGKNVNQREKRKEKILFVFVFVFVLFVLCFVLLFCVWCRFMFGVGLCCVL